MSFHGGLLGVIIAIFLFAYKQKQNPWALLDLMAVVTPIGLFFGRIANFINQEVMGRATDVPWAVVFNGDTTIPRHPSPLYEAASEGILLFIIMYCLYRFTSLRKRPGAIAGIMGILYALFRMICEQFRAPDAHIGFLTSWGLTMGQMLSGLMLIGGGVILACSLKKNKL
jgi:phosphatidylglycerol:prolipoprotein diacylglycerol transferase